MLWRGAIVARPVDALIGTALAAMCAPVYLWLNRTRVNP
jgi:hypothetical protein